MNSAVVFESPSFVRSSRGLALAVAMLSSVSACHHGTGTPTISSRAGDAPYAADTYAIDVGRVREAIRQDSACHMVFETLQGMVKRGEAAARLVDKTQFDSEMTAIESWLETQPGDACPALLGVITSQRVLCQDARIMFGMLHGADAPLDGNDAARISAYIAMHDQASAEAPLQQSLAWDAWRKEGPETPPNERHQRYFINAGTDAYIVRHDGSVGAAQSSPPYVGLVHTPALPDIAGRFLAIQGQGPMSAPQANEYAQAAMAFAVQQHATKVLFVNTAGGQIPSFAEAVASASRSSVVDASYVEYAGWKDGALVTPTDAAKFADEVATAAHVADANANASGAAPHRSLVVVNCNAGLDRSGTTNALAQLIVWARQERVAGRALPQIASAGHDAIDMIVANLKRAKPHSISSPARYMFIHQAWQAWVDGHASAASNVSPLASEPFVPSAPQQ